MYYAASTMICIPTSLDQPVGAALGAQAGFAKLSSAITQGGFGKVRKATETPFNMALEAPRAAIVPISNRGVRRRNSNDR
jgi:hypothetical protein